MRVSVIVPIYNAEAYIEKCAESLMMQTYGDIEYVFVDDASTDASIALLNDVVDRFEDRKNSVKVLRHDTNRGASVARFDGVREATGEWVIFVDSDDYVLPDYIAHLANRGEEAGADVVVCDYYEERESGNLVEKRVNLPNAKDEILAGIIVGSIKGYLVNKLAKRRLWSGIAADDGLAMFEDKHCVMQLCFTAKNIAYLAEPLYVYNRQNYGNSMSSKNKGALIGDAIRITELTQELLREKCDDEHSAKMLWQAYDEFCIGIKGLILLYGTREQMHEYNRVCNKKRYSLDMIIKQPVIPVYYKAVVACYEKHLRIFIPVIRGAFAMCKTIKDKLRH